MKRAFSLAMVAAFVISAGGALAEEQIMKARNIHYNKMWQKVDIDEQEGYIVGIYDNSGVTFHEDGERAILQIKGTLDNVGGTSRVEGYEIRTYDDGSTIMMRYEGTLDAGKVTCLKGTDRFEGIAAKAPTAAVKRAI